MPKDVFHPPMAAIPPTLTSPITAAMGRPISRPLMEAIIPMKPIITGSMFALSPFQKFFAGKDDIYQKL